MFVRHFSRTNVLLSSSHVIEPSVVVVNEPVSDSVPVVQGENKEVDILSLSVASHLLSITNIHTDTSESKLNIDHNAINENKLEDDRSSFATCSSNRIQIDECPVDSEPSVISDDSDGNDDKEKMLFDNDDDDEELRDNAGDEHLFNGYDFRADHEFTSTEIALALSLLKSRHCLTNSCMSNVCRLLKLLRVPSCPTDFRHVRSLICTPCESTIFTRDCIIPCPLCHQISSSSINSKSYTTCKSSETIVTNTTANNILYLEPQIRGILERTHLVKPNNDGDVVTDIIDSPFYRKLLNSEKKPFITLLMNSDGAVVKSISRSIWITTFVINELPPCLRFNRENLILGMMSIGSSKPHKVEMQVFLNGLVKQLLCFENVGLDYCPINSSSRLEKTLRVYLIAGSCDMPARSLLLNHSEATGYYGCVHCTIAGL